MRLMDEPTSAVEFDAPCQALDFAFKREVGEGRLNASGGCLKTAMPIRAQFRILSLSSGAVIHTHIASAGSTPNTQPRLIFKQMVRVHG